MEEKACIKCGTKYPSTVEYFVRNKSCKSGLENTCQECRRAQRKIHYYANKETIMAKMKIQHKANRKAINKQKQVRRKANEAHVVKREKIYREVNKEAIAKKGKEYQLAHKEAITQYKKDYRKANSTHINIKNQSRRAGKIKLLNTLTLEQWQAIKEHFNNSCAYCGEEKPLTQEHFYPLYLGGEYSVSNIVCACGRCNSSKSSRLFATWYPSQAFYSKSREKKILSYLKYKNNVQQIAFA